jgi:hypothetical protein
MSLLRLRWRTLKATRSTDFAIVRLAFQSPPTTCRETGEIRHAFAAYMPVAAEWLGSNFRASSALKVAFIGALRTHALRWSKWGAKNVDHTLFPDPA